MNYKRFIVFAAIVFSMLLTICTRENKASNHCLFIIGGDTVSMSLINRLVPDSLTRSRKIMRAALELASIKVNEKFSLSQADSQSLAQIGIDLARQLSRLEADPWTAEAGRSLYLAARFFAKKERELNSPQGVLSSADSVISSLVVICDSAVAKEFRIQKASLFDTSGCRNDSACLESLFSFLFHLSKPASRIVREFAVTAENQSAKVPEAASAAIKGLLSNGAAAPQTRQTRPITVSGAVTAPNNSQEALRLRGQRSIKDSIEKHIPDLEVLYKKHLKKHQNMEGVVWVTFAVNSAGNVISAQIKTSTIPEKDFLAPFQDYVVHQIHFQRIPEKAGNMSIEFPFEFSHDN
jgi:hypothetical protein